MATSKTSVLKSYRFLILLICGMALGAVVGAVWPGATVLKPLGTLFINLMLTAVVPLVFSSIASSVATMKNPSRTGKIMGSTVLLFVVTGMIAAVMMIFLCSVFPPVLEAWNNFEVSTDEPSKLVIGEMLVNAFTVDDFSKLLSRSNLLQIIVFAVLFGFGVNKAGGPECVVARALVGVSDAMLQIVKLITYYAPVAFFGLFANLVALYGPQLIGDYGRAMLLYYPTVFIYCLIMFPIWAYIGGGAPAVKMMFSKIAAPALTALGSCSSASVIPTNMRVAEESHIPKDVAEMVIPLGATMHMDGVVISTVLKTAFLFGVFGMDFSRAGIANWGLLIFIAVFAAVGSAAVPRGGLIVESIICTLFFPENMAIAFPLILAIGNLCDPGSTMVNAAGDYVLSFIVTRIVDGKDWLKNALAGRTDQETIK